jgi:nitrilase
MPLLRYSLYSQNVNLWLAPTADARDSWWPLMRTVGNEGRCFVLSAISCVKRKHLPEWIHGVPASGSLKEQPSLTNGSPLSPTRSHGGRRRSTITVQEERHSLVLPAGDDDVDNATEAIAEDAELSIDKTRSRSHASQQPQVAGSDSAGEDFICRGGSCIAGPFGNVIKEPLWEVEDGGLLVTDVDFEDCERGRLDLDVAGSYSRNDAFKLTVEGLDLNPPP